jgi:hypothetical protein
MSESQSEETAEELLPDLETFTVRTETVIELDFTESEVQAMMQQTDTETPEEAVSQMMFQREQSAVKPQEKLLSMEITTDGPSDD